MANKTNCVINGRPYYRLTRTVGRRLNENGAEVPVKKQFYGKNKKEAEEAYQKYINRKEQGIDHENQYFGILADHWIYAFLVNDSELKDRTKELYIGQWNRYVKPSDLYLMRVDNISAAVLQQFYNELDAPISALRAIDKVMKRFYRYLDLEGYARNIMASIRVPKKRTEKRTKDKNKVVVWSDEEIHAILNGFDKAQKGFRLRFLVVLAYYTGCRVSELLGLTYDDFADKTVSINKQAIRRAVIKRNKKTVYEMDIDTPKSQSAYRIIPLNDAVMEELERHKKWQKKDMLKNGYRTEYLFTTDSGALYDRHNVTHALTRYYKRIGVPNRGFHTYRHTFGTNLCRSGVPIQVASSLLGHADINVTMKYYVNVDQDEKRRAIERLSEAVNK